MLFKKHQNTIESAVKANAQREYFTHYPEHPKAYGDNAMAEGAVRFKALLQQPFKELMQDGMAQWKGEERSPYTLEPLGISYPCLPVATLVENARQCAASWAKASAAERTALLVECLEQIKERFFEIAHATMHTTGQPFIMSFQASGPHANDRALEAIAMGYQELTRFPQEVIWNKSIGKFNVKLKKTYHAIPKGIGLVIGCSTFPIWNTFPGLFADLVTGNPVIVKPHPKAVLPIAIAVATIQKVLQQNGFAPQICQLAADMSDQLIAKELCEHPAIQLIDYTGGTAFGNYVESLPHKTVFTEKAGVNSVILDSVQDLDAVLQNLAFSVSLYSGQMCTAPQNFFIPEGGVQTPEGKLPYSEVVQKIKDNIQALARHPKMGAGTLGAIQNEQTLQRAKTASTLNGNLLLAAEPVINEEYGQARTCSPVVLELSAADKTTYEQELFGPVVLLIKTKDSNHSLQLAKELAQKQGAITCAAYTTDESMMARIAEEMNSAFTPVSFNLIGSVWVNQHSAFSDFHGTGGNPAGNASFTNPAFIVKRFIWVGNRTLVN